MTGRVVEELRPGLGAELAVGRQAVGFLEGADGAAGRAFEDPVDFDFLPGADQALLRPDDEVAFGADLQQRVFDFRDEAGDRARAGGRAERPPLGVVVSCQSHQLGAVP